jgi:hypothetical protein
MAVDQFSVADARTFSPCVLHVHIDTLFDERYWSKATRPSS